MASREPMGGGPKLAILSRSFTQSAGGAENYAVNLAQHLAHGFEVHVFCERSDVVHPGITVHRMGWTIKRPRWVALFLFAWWSWRQTRQGFDIVHSHENTWHGNVQTVHVRPMRFNLFARASGPASRLWVYLNIFTSPRLLAHLALEGLRFRGGEERVVVAVAPALGDLIESTYGVQKSRIRVVPPGIRMPDRASGDELPVLSKMNARKALGLPPDGWMLLLVGHNFEKKGLLAALRSLPLLSADVALLVVGGQAPLVEVWRARCVQQGLGGRVFFTGTLPDSAIAFAAADCLVHATLDDMFPLVVLEAMSAKVPVVMSMAPYCLAAPLVEKAQAAWMLHNPHSEQEIVHAIESLRANAVLRERQLDLGVQFVRQHSWSQVAQQQVQIYQQLLSKNPANR
jgi:glycosyltransferase involved in cell wall biosynthesis